MPAETLDVQSHFRDDFVVIHLSSRKLGLVLYVGQLRTHRNGRFRPEADLALNALSLSALILGR